MWQQDEEPIQQTCYATDTISRQAAIDAVSDCGICIQRIVDLPYAQPEQRWIPCSETVDIPDHEVLACDKYGGNDNWIFSI
jgi:hypothetical protein